MFRLFVVAAAVTGVYLLGGQWAPMHTVVFTILGFGFTWLLGGMAVTGYGAYKITK
jgi:hypothetical protein